MVPSYYNRVPSHDDIHYACISLHILCICGFVRCLFKHYICGILYCSALYDYDVVRSKY